MPTFQSSSDQVLCEVNPLQLAYIGDSVYDLMVRGHLLLSGKRLHHMHLEATARVKATSQARSLEMLLPHLTEEETDMVRKGRNAHAHHQAPKSASQADYCLATGLEAMLGYLYVRGREDRLRELFMIMDPTEAEGTK